MKQGYFTLDKKELTQEEIKQLNKLYSKYLIEWVKVTENSTKELYLAVLRDLSKLYDTQEEVEVEIITYEDYSQEELNQIIENNNWTINNNMVTDSEGYEFEIPKKRIVTKEMQTQTNYGLISLMSDRNVNILGIWNVDNGYLFGSEKIITQEQEVDEEGNIVKELLFTINYDNVEFPFKRSDYMEFITDTEPKNLLSFAGYGKIIFP